MLETILFTEDWRCFKANEAFAFSPGVNLLVGDQGSGKSSLMSAIRNSAIKLKRHDLDYREKKVATIKTEGKPCQCFKFDFEKDNFRTKPYFDAGSTTFHIASMWKSHGEQNMAILDNMAESQNSVIIMDEPDMALSLRSIYKLMKMLDTLADNGNQIIAAVHNPLLIEHFPLVLSLEHRAWIPSDVFIESQAKELIECDS